MKGFFNLFSSLFSKSKSPEKVYKIPTPDFEYTDSDIIESFALVRNIKILDVIPDKVLYDMVSTILKNPYTRAPIPQRTIEAYYPEMKKNDLKYILSTVTLTAKSLYDIKRDRSQNNVLSNWYIWNASACKTHKHLNNTINSWGTPISPEIAKDRGVYSGIHPSQSYHCLCLAQPIFSYRLQITKLQSPLKIHLNNSLQKISKKDFKEMLKAENNHFLDI